MNLLRDPWIAVRGLEGVRLIGLEKLLCSDESYTLCLPRDDMEMSTLQLAICLTQVAIMPENIHELTDRINNPMDEIEYRQRTERLVPWFQLDHPEWPFMQIMEGTGNVTNIQKLMPGLPEGGGSPCFFNRHDEVRILGAPMTAIALFQQATMTPSFGGGPGGGFKAPLRGQAPMTTLVWDSSLRKMLWYNVLCKTEVMKVAPNYSEGNESEWPVWVRPIERNKEVQINHIGLLRGLFWQPAHIKIIWQARYELCDFTGIASSLNCSEFEKEPFGYTLKGYWPHPHSPRELILRKEQTDLEERALSFRTQEPAWTHCHAYVYRHENSDKTGYTPAAVISQFSQFHHKKKLHLAIGGYCNNQAKIEQRRHELITFGEGWENQESGYLTSIIYAVLEEKKLLHKKLLWLKKAVNSKKQRGIGISLTDEAERLFYLATEPLIRRCLQTFTFKEKQSFKKDTLEAVRDICLKVFDDLTKPFEHDPGIMASIVVGRGKLKYSLNAIITPVAKKQKTKKGEVK